MESRCSIERSSKPNAALQLPCVSEERLLTQSRSAAATPRFAVCLAVLFGSPASAVAQWPAAPESWTPISQNAKAMTGRVTFSPREIAFQNGTSLPLAPIGQMLFRSEAKKKVMANLYKTASSADAGAGLCKGKPVAYIVVWRSEQAGRETERGMAPFSGPLLNAGSADDCGHFAYDVGKH